MVYCNLALWNTFYTIQGEQGQVGPQGPAGPPGIGNPGSQVSLNQEQADTELQI